MAKKKANSKKSDKVKKRKAGAPNAPAASEARAWLELLRDPCSARLTRPCYGGTDSGYLCRTVDLVQLTSSSEVGLTSGAVYPVDAYLQFTPFNLSASTGFVAATRLASAGTGGGASSTFGSSTNFISNSSVYRYRPVACCLKWVPNGAYSSRQGTVGLSVLTGMEVIGGTAYSTTTLVGTCQRIATNGSSMHEARWLPTAVDENFTSTASGANSAAGSVIVALKGVDGTATSATAITANGYVEITTVWEWQPNATSGLTIATQAPNPYTSQAVLSQIGNFGAFVYDGAMAAAGAMGRGMAREGLSLLTGGVSRVVQRGTGVPLIRY